MTDIGTSSLLGPGQGFGGAFQPPAGADPDQVRVFRDDLESYYYLDNTCFMHEERAVQDALQRLLRVFHKLFWFHTLAETLHTVCDDEDAADDDDDVVDKDGCVLESAEATLMVNRGFVLDQRFQSDYQVSKQGEKSVALKLAMVVLYAKAVSTDGRVELHTLTEFDAGVLRHCLRHRHAFDNRRWLVVGVGPTLKHRFFDLSETCESYRIFSDGEIIFDSRNRRPEFQCRKKHQRDCRQVRRKRKQTRHERLTEEDNFILRWCPLFRPGYKSQISRTTLDGIPPRIPETALKNVDQQKVGSKRRATTVREIPRRSARLSGGGTTKIRRSTRLAETNRVKYTRMV